MVGRGQTGKIKISPCSRDFGLNSGPVLVHPKTKVSGYLAKGIFSYTYYLDYTSETLQNGISI